MKKDKWHTVSPADGTGIANTLSYATKPAPYFKKYGKKPGIKAFVDGMTTTVIGANCWCGYCTCKKTIYRYAFYVDCSNYSFTFVHVLKFQSQ